jgi:hypothetical protein
MAPKKTRMGSLNKGFHFLGIQFDVARTTPNASQNEQPHSSVKVSLHPRSIRRSIDKIRLKQEEARLLNGNRTLSAEHPANVQSLCYRWAKWWARQHPHLEVVQSHVAAWAAMDRRLRRWPKD